MIEPSIQREQPQVAVSPDTHEWVGFSLRRVWIIAVNTLTESMRQKVYLILLLFALVVIACASFLSQFAFGEEAEQIASEQLKFIKDFGLGALSVLGMLIAIVGTAQLIPNEVENRTIYTILSKPVRRVEFLLGKYAGSVLLIFVSLVMMSLMFGAVLQFKQHRLVNDVVEQTRQALASGGHPDEQETRRLIAQINRQAMDPNLVKGIVLTFVELALLASITLLASTFSTSMIFNVAVAVLVFFSGHLVGAAKELWEHSRLVQYLLALIPDLGMFSVADDIILGNVIPWSHVMKVALYGIVYLATVVAASHFIFLEREI